MKIRKIFRWLLAGFFTFAGLNHFLMPRPYLSMMPPSLPAPRLLVMMSGVAEMAGGIGVLSERFRRAAGWGLIALLIAVFPANVQVALHGWPGMDIQPWVLWARLPFQLVFMVWVYFTCLAKQPFAHPFSTELKS